MSAISVFAPAKLNLFLAITGRRNDGFHDLVSVVAPLDFGDTLMAEPADELSLSCASPDVPTDETNLVLRAARAFVAENPRQEGRAGARFTLAKRIPVGAGLGGGSSDAVAALRALNALSAAPRDPATLAEIAARLGSDCPLFLQNGPVVIRGRGERVEPLPEPAARRLRGRRVLVFKPAFGIATAWAYARLATAGRTAIASGYGGTAPMAYIPTPEAEALLAGWLANPDAPAENLLLNNMERPVFAQHLALPTLLGQLHEEFGLMARMSGSGSACFALLPDDLPAAPITAMIQGAWGASAFVMEARLA